MFIDFLKQRFLTAGEKTALTFGGSECSYRELHSLIEKYQAELTTQRVESNTVVSLEADFSPNAVAMLLALIENRNIVVPLTHAVGTKTAEFRETAQVQHMIALSGAERATYTRATASAETHPLLAGLKAKNHPGLVLFSSGSTGKSKAALHDFVPLLEKFKTVRGEKRMISFLLFDHIGGINTLLHCLSNVGTLVTVTDRSPRTVAENIAKHRVQILPTSPTFLNLILLSRVWESYDLGSLELITYGTEPMPESTLTEIHKVFPKVRLQQTYGLSELGILRSKSRSSDSLWVQVGGEGFQTRVADGLLEIKAQSAMLGYLNAPSPFTADGWFKTGDVVESDGEWIKILGRKSEIINVGGEKVFPAEVESVLQLIAGVEEAIVTGEPNPILGHIVKAVVKLSNDETVESFRTRMRAFCKDKLLPFKIPQKVVLEQTGLHTERFKKDRVRAAKN